MSRPAAIVLWLVGLFGAVLLSGRTALDQAERAEAAEDELRTFELAEVELDRELMRATNIAVDSYDQVTAASGALETQLQLAARAARTVLDAAPADLERIEDAVAHKLSDVEDFKSDHAVMRNSMNYVPTLLEEAEGLLAALEFANKAEALRDVRRLRQETLLYAELGGEPRASRIRGYTTQLGDIHDVPAEVQQRLTLVNRHIEALIQRRAAVWRHLDAYFSYTTGEALKNLRGRLGALRADALASAGTRRNLRVVLLVVLALLAVRFLLGMRRRTRSLEAGLEARTLALEAANAELEAEVDARRRTEHELAEALANARAATQAKADFLANMSHEIRTPMNGVIGMTDILLGTKLDPEQAGFVRSIERSATALLTIINDILDVSKIEAGRLDIVVQPFDLQQLVADVAGVLEPAARGKSLSLKVVFGPAVPRVVMGDPIRVRQILLNLAGNAVKFTEAGFVHLEARHVEGSTVELAVADSGIGIAADDLPIIFDAFSQADSSTTRRFGGTGLGLAICKRLALLMDGEIAVTSTLGHGSRFALTLPLPPAPSSSAPPVRAAEADSLPPSSDALFPLHVLLAEDNAINQRVATRLLEKLGCSVDTVDDGTTAVAQASVKPYDLVFMDCQMPSMDGYEATQALRRNGFARPIVAMTAHAMPGDRERCLEVGMNDYIAKPISRAELERVLRTWSTDEDRSVGEDGAQQG
ncbi:MAG: response regulator [Myxococcales bacterium]|nr:response regulator [Myxococcales bacterium]